MTPLELSPSPPTAAASLAWPATREATASVPQVRELGRLISDIRDARAFLDAVGLPDQPVRLEDVVGYDPHD